MHSKQDMAYADIISIMEDQGYIHNVKIATALQGTIWKSIQQSTNQRVVIKVANIDLHANRIMVDRQGKVIRVDEDILQETAILQYLSSDPTCPDSIVQYIDAFQSESHYFLVMQDGGHNFFDFIQKVHHFIKIGRLDVEEWHTIAKCIFQQMVECVEYLHRKQVSHFDLSLENFVISDVSINVYHDDNGQEKIRFSTDIADIKHDSPSPDFRPIPLGHRSRSHSSSSSSSSSSSECIHPSRHGKIQVRLIDFGLAEYYKHNTFESNKYCGKSNYQSPEIMKHQRNFCAKSNDIWCLGLCLFSMIIGGRAWYKTHESDQAFNCVMNGHLKYVLESYGRLSYVNEELLVLFDGVLKYEKDRMTLNQLKQCAWLNY